jgi:hypothetical protein
MRIIAGALALGIVAGACASSSSSAPAASGTASANVPRRGNSTLITQEEIEAVHLETIYDVIERLRPNMLRTHGPPSRINGATPAEAGASSSHINVYLNGTWIRDVSMLRNIQAASVKQVQYLSSSDATTRFGTGHVAGAILITGK